MVCFVNCNNCKNIMEVSVVVEMTVCNLRFVGLNDSTLILPPLTMHLQPHALLCSRKFSVRFRWKVDDAILLFVDRVINVNSTGLPSNIIQIFIMCYVVRSSLIV